MNLKYFSIYLLLFCINSVTLQSATCRYYIFESTWGYRCDLSQKNSFNGEITQINGNHLRGYNDDSVKGIEGGTKKFPSLVCEKFKNIFWIEFHAIVEKLDENSFRNCKKLRYLNLANNKIKELPENVFAPLINIEEIYLARNKLASINSNAFESHEFLLTLSFHSNQLSSIDESLLGKIPATTFIQTAPNSCVSGEANFVNTLEARSEHKSALLKCFENFQLGFYSTTTTTTTLEYLTTTELISTKTPRIKSTKATTTTTSKPTTKASKTTTRKFTTTTAKSTTLKPITRTTSPLTTAKRTVSTTLKPITRTTSSVTAAKPTISTTLKSTTTSATTTEQSLNIWR